MRYTDLKYTLNSQPFTILVKYVTIFLPNSWLILDLILTTVNYE